VAEIDITDAVEFGLEAPPFAQAIVQYWRLRSSCPEVLIFTIVLLLW